MNLFKLIFGKYKDNELKARDGEIAMLNDEINKMNVKIKQQTDVLDHLNKSMAELMLKNQELTSENSNLNSQIKILQDHQKQVNADNSEAGKELENITYRMQTIINGSLRGVDFIWRDRGYLVQINVDSKVDGNYSVLRDRVKTEMQNSKFCEMQEINNRTFFIKVK